MEHHTGEDPDAGVRANIAKIIGVSVFSSVLAIASMTGRFVARKKNRQNWEADDWWILVAVVFILADSACYLAGVRYGFGRHVHTVDRKNVLTFFRIAWATFLLYGCAITAVKISVLLFYRRMFPTRTTKILLIILGILSIIWFVLLTLMSIFQCTPVRKGWDPTVPGKCIPHLDIFIGMQAVNIFLDIAVLCLPISNVMALRISRARRIAVAGIFSLGGLSIVFAAVRLAVLVQNKTQTDITFGADTANWSIVEPGFQTFCACLPCMAPLIRSSSWVKRLGSCLRSSLQKASYGSSRSTEGGTYRRPRGPAQRTYADSITLQKSPGLVGVNGRHSTSTDHLPLRAHEHDTNLV